MILEDRLTNGVDGGMKQELHLSSLHELVRTLQSLDRRLFTRIKTVSIAVIPEIIELGNEETAEYIITSAAIRYVARLSDGSTRTAVEDAPSLAFVGSSGEAEDVQRLAAYAKGQEALLSDLGYAVAAPQPDYEAHRIRRERPAKIASTAYA